MKYRAEDFARIYHRACGGLTKPMQRRVAAAFAAHLRRLGGARLAADVLAALPRIAAERSGVIRLKIAAARKLRPAEIKAILALFDLEKNRADLESVIEPRLLGGFVAQTANVRYDASFAGKLERIRKALTPV